MIPHIRVPKHEVTDRNPDRVSFQDRDNFIRNLATVLLGPRYGAALLEDWSVPTPASPSARNRAPVLTLAEVKTHCRIEADQTEEDVYLAQLEMAARLHTENYLRRELEADCGENIKQALLMLIAHWYRQREAVTDREYMVIPMAYEALLSPDRDYPPGVY